MSFTRIQAMIQSLKNNQRNRSTIYQNNSPKGIGELKNTGFPEKSISPEALAAFREEMKKEKRRNDVKTIVVLTGFVMIAILVLIFT